MCADFLTTPYVFVLKNWQVETLIVKACSCLPNFEENNPKSAVSWTWREDLNRRTVRFNLAFPSDRSGYPPGQRSDVFRYRPFWCSFSDGFAENSGYNHFLVHQIISWTDQYLLYHWFPSWVKVNHWGGIWGEMGAKMFRGGRMGRKPHFSSIYLMAPHSAPHNRSIYSVKCSASE